MSRRVVYLYIDLFSFSVNLLIEKLHNRGIITQGAVLLSVRPLMIGSKTRIDNFKKYNPPRG